jgi:hypothetical protein
MPGGLLHDCMDQPGCSWDKTFGLFHQFPPGSVRLEIGVKEFIVPGRMIRHLLRYNAIQGLVVDEHAPAPHVHLLPERYLVHTYPHGDRWDASAGRVLCIHYVDGAGCECHSPYKVPGCSLMDDEE